MNNYFDKYLKYKLKYLKIKNLQIGGYTYDCTDEPNSKVICEPKPEGQWSNLEECTKSNICIQNSKINNEYVRQHEAIMLIRKNKNLLEEYGIYKNGNIDPNLVETVNLIPDLDDLEDILDSINLIKEKKPLFENYGVYKKGYKLLSYHKLKEGYLKLINIIEENKQLFEKYGIYKAGSDLTSLVKNGDIESLVRRFKRSLPIIKLIEDDTVLIGDKVQLYNQYKDNISILENFLNYKTIQIPKTFYISGLLTFAVYKNEKINKIIYLLGERHGFKNLCDNNEIRDGTPHYYADDLFMSLLNCHVQGKNTHKYNNKLDVFLELRYDRLSEESKFSESINKYNFKDSYMKRTFDNIYNSGCKPNYTKKLLEETDICLYEPYTRFHHADMRYIKDDFVKYINFIYYKIDTKINLMSNARFDIDYSTYDINTLLEIYKSSTFMNKIKKQINNIKIDYIKKFFNTRLREYNKMCIDNINSGDLTYSNIQPKIEISDYRSEIFDVIRNIFLGIMDFYLMSRVFRIFDDDNGNILHDTSNIIIYAGDSHVKTYITWLKQLGFEEKYNVSNSTNLEKMACLKVDNFNIDYF
jgi:hypothetical protein